MAFCRWVSSYCPFLSDATTSIWQPEYLSTVTATRRGRGFANFDDAKTRNLNLEPASLELTPDGKPDTAPWPSQ